MPWNSGLFIAGVGAWLANGDSASDDLTAEEIAKMYGRAARAVMPKSPKFAAVPLTLKSDQIIAAGFSASFKLARALQIGAPNAAVWLPAATSVVTYWAGVTFSPMPPPPGGLVGTTNVVTIPGLPTPLNFGIQKAFKQQNPFKCARQLDKAMKGHLKLVTGLWTGTAPAAPSPVPLVVPWVGLS